MKLFATIILILQITTGFSQVEFESDFDKKELFSSLTPKIKELNKDFDFQFRFWKHEGMVFPARRKLFTLTFKKGKWDCNSFVITLQDNGNFKIDRNRNPIDNCDSTWNYFWENNILTLPDMELLRKNFYNKIEIKANEPVLIKKEVEDSLLKNNSINEVKVFAKGEVRKKIVVFDGARYFVELLRENKYRRIEYYSPLIYAEAYTHIPELQNFSNILKCVNKSWDKKE